MDSKKADEKVLSLISTICSIIIIVLVSCRQIFGMWENAIILFEPFLV